MLATGSGSGFTASRNSNIHAHEPTLSRHLQHRLALLLVHDSWRFRLAHLAKLGSQRSSHPICRRSRSKQSANLTCTPAKSTLEHSHTMTQEHTNPIAELIRQHHQKSTNPPEFLRQMAQSCGVHIATAYRWLNAEKVPDGLNTLKLTQWLAYITGKEQQP